MDLKNFLDCIRSSKKPEAPIEMSHSSARASQVGNLAIRSGKTVRRDGQVSTGRRGWPALGVAFWEG